jgi:phosphoribosyl 1,2-cyclic phosphate phosphodiesterase
VRRNNETVAHFPPSGSSLEGVINKEGHTITVPPATDTLEITPIKVMHGKMPILGYIFREKAKSLAYITDMKSIEESEYEYLHDIDTLVVNALRFEKEHHSHQLVDDAIAFSRRIGAKRTYLIHLTHDIGTHDIANSRLPEGFEFAYDCQVINL